MKKVANHQTNAADEDQIRAAEERVERRERQRVDDIKDLLSSRAGRRFYWDLLGYCGVFTTSFTGNSQTFFNEGKRMVGLKLIGDLNLADPEAYLKMVREEQEEAGRNE